MELAGKQTCFVQRLSSAASLGSLSWSPSCCRIISDILPPSSKLLLPRTCERVLSRTTDGRSRGECRGWKWVCQHQVQRLARPGVQATATISAGGRSITSGRRQSTSRRPEGSGGFNVDLELEILAFMLQSGKSDAFPSKEELITAGRWDLVEAIVAEGGWLASGWERQANASVFGGVMQETAHRSLSRQRAVANKTKAVRSARRSRGRPKLVGRKSLSITASLGENSEPGEPQKDVIAGQTEDQTIDSPRVENDNGAAKLEPNERERATLSSFERVRKERGSRFPSNSAGYKLWEFESLADFIEYRKLDAKNRSVQGRHTGLCSNSSARRKRFDPEAAKRRSEVCERSCDAASEVPRQGSTSCKGMDVKNDLGTASTVEQDTKVDEALNVTAELDTVLSVHQYPRVDETVYSGPEVHTATIIEQDTRVDGAMSPEAELDTASWGEAVESKDGAITPEADLNTASWGEAVDSKDGAITPEADLNTASWGEAVDSKDGASPKAELDTASWGEAVYSKDGAISPKAELDTASWGEAVDSKDGAISPEAELNTVSWGEAVDSKDGAISPEAELNTASWGEAVDSKDGNDLGYTQASSIAPEGDILSSAEHDSTTEEASSSDEHMVEPSTGQQEIRGPVAETEDKPKKKKKEKKRRNVNIEKTEDVCKTPEKLSEALDWINQIVEQRERWMQEAKSSSSEGPSEKPTSIQDRIRSLEDRLSAARTGLLSGREALGQKGDAQGQPNTPSDEHTRRLAELREASDELEYTENKILRISSEITTTRREVAALEGAHGVYMMDVRNVAGENEKQTETTRTGLQSLRTARIVWPHPAREVFLIGSFDGWNEKIKMELSGAGVFVVSLPLPPGRYEIKFIVDGTWRVDTGRPIIYVAGYENNVVIIPEQFTFGQRR